MAVLVVCCPYPGRTVFHGPEQALQCGCVGRGPGCVGRGMPGRPPYWGNGPGRTGRPGCGRLFGRCVGRPFGRCAGLYTGRGPEGTGCGLYEGRLVGDVFCIFGTIGLGGLPGDPFWPYEGFLGGP